MLHSHRFYNILSRYKLHQFEVLKTQTNQFGKISDFKLSAFLHLGHHSIHKRGMTLQRHERKIARSLCLLNH